MEDSKLLVNQYNQAAEAIKTAILQSQYEASQGANRVQLALYYGIGTIVLNISSVVTDDFITS